MNRLAGVGVFLSLVLLAPPAPAALRVGVDWNGDGLIRTRARDRVPVDAPTRDRPFVFWINHDQDDLETGGETHPIERPDASTPRIDSTRDLEDLTRLRIEIDDLSRVPAGAALEFRWTNLDAGQAPAVNLFRAADPACARSHLLDAEAARHQLAEPWGRMLGTVGDAPLRLPLAALGAADLDGAGFCLLLEGAAPGEGELRTRLVVGDAFLEEAPALSVQLRHVKSLYVRTTVPWPEEIGPPWSYTREQPPVPDLAWEPDLQGHAFEAPWYETGDHLVWAYGWLRSGPGQREQATTQAGETVFKRLWLRGFRGRLHYFHWPSVKPQLAYGLLESEYRAYKTAPALVDYVHALPREKRVHVTAHSLGGVLLTEALRLGLAADSALLQVAAMPAGALDPRETLLLPEMNEASTPFRAEQGGYFGYVEDTRTPVYTMYNHADVTFFGWALAQRNWKPTRKRGGVRYAWVPDAPEGERARLYRRQGLFGEDWRPVTDPHEILAFVAQARTHAIGAEARVQGVVRHAFDLARDPYAFGEGHVVGWTRPVQETTAFYNLLLDIFDIAYVSELL